MSDISYTNRNANTSRRIRCLQPLSAVVSVLRTPRAIGGWRVRGNNAVWLGLARSGSGGELKVAGSAVRLEVPMTRSGLFSLPAIRKGLFRMPIYFYSAREKPYGCFSNFSPHGFELDGTY
jgi:hypothetical protein